MNDLVTSDGSPGSAEGPEILLGVDSPFHGSVVTPDDAVQVQADETTAVAPQLALLLQFADHIRIR
ncbi:MAG: hypothetical protein ABFD89_08015 [Bryobacteraceae bacterium]